MFKKLFLTSLFVFISSQNIYAFETISNEELFQEYNPERNCFFVMCLAQWGQEAHPIFEWTGKDLVAPGKVLQICKDWAQKNDKDPGACHVISCKEIAPE